MYKELIIPLAILVIGAIVTRIVEIVIKDMEENSKKFKKIARILFWFFVITAILVLIFGFFIPPFHPANLSATQTSVVGTSTEIAKLIQNTQVASDSTQQASATRTIATELARIEQATVTTEAGRMQMAEKIHYNAELCKYAPNADTLASAINSYNSLLLPLIISAIAVIAFLIASLQDSKSKILFITLLILSITGFIASLVQYTSHPLSKLPQELSSFTNQEIQQMLLNECTHQLELRTDATRTQIAGLTQGAYHQTETKSVAETIQAADKSQLMTLTANSNLVATQEAYNIWLAQHQFIDEFTDDIHEWDGDSKSSYVEVDQATSRLDFETKGESRIAFWMCNLCLLPTDYNNYSFEVKMSAPLNTKGFNFGLLFGCSKFNSELVSCQGIHIIEESTIIVVKTGTEKEYNNIKYPIKPNAKGLVSVRWEVRDQNFKLWINDQLVMSDFQLDGGGGGMFGFYSDPPGSAVSFERIEINPLP